MRGKSIILIIIALGCGLVASIGISQMLDRGDSKSGPTLETKKILVAMVDVDIGEPLTAQMLALEEWPKDKIPDGAFSEVESVLGMASRQRLFAGEPILKRKLIDPMARGGVTQQIPEGYRVLAVKATTAAVAGLILPGDRVDVLVYLRKSGDVAETGTRTILKDIRVFAVNEHTDRETDENGKVIIAKTVSLLLTPGQVETLLLASRLGQISLSIRRPGDTMPDDAQGTTVAKFFGEAESDSPAEREDFGPAEPDGGLAGFLESQQQASAPQEAQPAASVAPQEVAWTIDIIEPEGISRYQFTDPTQPPELVTGSFSDDSSADMSDDELSTEDGADAPTDDDEGSTDSEDSTSLDSPEDTGADDDV